MNNDLLKKLIGQLANKIIEQENDSQLQARKIRKEISEHHQNMEKRRKKFDLIRNR